MGRRRQELIRVIAALVVLWGVMGGHADGGTSGAAPPPDEIPFVCPVTFPNGATPFGEDPSAGHHGSGALWTALWPFGVIMIRPEYIEPDGSLGMKFPWWRDVEGPLEIEGRRLDAPASPLRWHTPPNYEGGSRDFYATRLFFSTEGCWEVTGRAGDAGLTFVTLVVLTEEARLLGASATPTVVP